MGRPRPVREVMALLGSSPLIAMPLNASNAGKNYGTGGDFTANSGPYVGARGASEFWARGCLLPYDASVANYLSQINTSSLKSDFSLMFSFKKTNTASLVDTSRAFLTIWDSGGKNGITIGKPDLTHIDLHFYDNTYTQRKITSLFTAPFDALWHTVCISRNSTGWNVLVDGVTKPITYNALTALDIKNITINCMAYLNEEYSIGVSYFTDTYIDFSQEVNRLKFVDGLGYPLDLSKQIESGAIPKPLIYLPFDDTSNLGKNLGTGGDFTVNGTVTAGADVLG